MPIRKTTHTHDMPHEVRGVLSALEGAGFEAYAVGGCVRDILLGVKPKDWDVTTSAKPDEITKLFPKSFYENKFLTVTVQTGSSDATLAEIEVTTYRTEGKYSDQRHPDSVEAAPTLEADMSRRDFTVNAMALEPGGAIIDLYGGREDIAKKCIRAVGDAEARFGEDALRMMRAARLSVELGFEIEKATKGAIQKRAADIQHIAAERIRDELSRIFASSRARQGIELLHELGLLRFILPEIEEGIDITNRPKIFTVWEHNLKALEYGVKADYALDVRIAALLHDAGKPRTRGPMKNNEWTFYGHDVVGSKMAREALTRLKFPGDTVEKISTLIRWHLFKYDPDEGVTDSSVRRLIRNVGPENMEDLVRLRICDRMGMDRPKAVPYRLRHFQFRVEKILREEEAPTPKMLKVGGAEIMEALGIRPGPKIGRIIEVLMQEVIDEPKKNTREQLLSRVRELGGLSDEELVRIAEASESKVEMLEDERISGIKQKYWVK